MIDPKKITKYGRNLEELQEMLLFCVFVAGKNAATTAKLLDRFLKYVAHACGESIDTLKEDDYCGYSLDDIEGMLSHGPLNLANLLKEFGFGCYNRRDRTIRELIELGEQLDLETCTCEDLEKVYGIGMKTSRFFILHTRKDADVVPIDTHAIKYLHANGVIPNEKPSLARKNYLRLSEEYKKLREKKCPDKTLAEFDLAVWNHYANGMDLDF